MVTNAMKVAVYEAYVRADWAHRAADKAAHEAKCALLAAEETLKFATVAKNAVCAREENSQ